MNDNQRLYLKSGAVILLYALIAIAIARAMQTTDTGALGRFRCLTISRDGPDHHQRIHPVYQPC